MINRHHTNKISRILSVLVVLSMFTGANTFSFANSPEVTELVNNNTTGYYNNSLGTILDGTQLQFPPANSYGYADITLPNSPEPNLDAAASIMGDWLSIPQQLNGNWSALLEIPKRWDANDENAIIYPISVGPQGFTYVVGNFGVDNGLFVWVNGQYKFGALGPGPVGGFEYTNINLGSLPPGLNYIQILREDHSDFGGFTVLITGTVETAAGHITSPIANTNIGPTTLSFSTDAWSNSGVGIKHVAFFVFYDAAWHATGIDSSPPYEVIWQTPNTLLSQQLRFRIDIVDNADNIVSSADVVDGVNYFDYLGNPDIKENWIPFRAYLNQRSLEEAGDYKCNVASMAMIMAMNSKISWDYLTMSTKANNMYPRVLGKDGLPYVSLMVKELKNQGMDAQTSTYTDSDAWLRIKQEIDAGRPVIVRTAHGVVTADGHFIVAVGYREVTVTRQLIVYDPYGSWNGTCCIDNYDRNSTDSGSHKGRWVSYDFNLLFGSSNSLITARIPVGGMKINSTPTTRPDLMSDEPEDIGTYLGIKIPHELWFFLPIIKR